MLESCEVIDTDMVREGHVARSIRRDMNQRSRASPVFIGCAQEEDLRDNFVGGSTIKQSANLAGDGVSLRQIGKWERSVGKKTDEVGCASRDGWANR